MLRLGFHYVCTLLCNYVWYSIAVLLDYRPKPLLSSQLLGKNSPKPLNPKCQTLQALNSNTLNPKPHITTLPHYPSKGRSMGP